MKSFTCLLLGFLFCCSNFASAEVKERKGSLFDGIYGGVSLNITQTNESIKGNGVFGTRTGLLPDDYNLELFDRNFISKTNTFGIDFFAGYGQVVLKHLYLGGEAGLDIFGSTGFIDARFGFVLNDTFPLMPYLSIGYSGRGKSDVPPVYDSNNVDGDSSADLHGLRLGVGLEYSINDNMFLRFSYHHNISSGSNTLNYNDIGKSFQENISQNFRIEQDIFRLSFIYRLKV